MRRLLTIFVLAPLLLNAAIARAQTGGDPPELLSPSGARVEYAGSPVLIWRQSQTHGLAGSDDTLVLDLGPDPTTVPPFVGGDFSQPICRIRLEDVFTDRTAAAATGTGEDARCGTFAARWDSRTRTFSLRFDPGSLRPGSWKWRVERASSARFPGGTSEARDFAIELPPLRLSASTTRVEGGITRINVRTSRFAIVSARVYWRRRVILTRSWSEDETPLSRRLDVAWSCRRPGAHKVELEAVGEAGGQMRRTLRFSVPSCRHRWAGALLDFDRRRNPVAEQGGYHALGFADRFRRRTHYRVCLTGPARRCYSRRTSRRGYSEINVSRWLNDVGGPGRWIATWYVRGRSVARYRFVLRSEGV